MDYPFVCVILSATTIIQSAIVAFSSSIISFYSDWSRVVIDFSIRPGWILLITKLFLVHNLNSTILNNEIIDSLYQNF